MSQKIIDLVTAVVAPAIPEQYELVDIEYEKLGGDYVLCVNSSCVIYNLCFSVILLGARTLLVTHVKKP